MTTLKSDVENAIRAKTNMSEEDAFATIDKRWLTKKFTFQGQDIDLVWSCGLFITMNPGLLKPNFNSFYFIFLVFRLCWSYRITR
jgi:acyl-ACP thioesterase